MKTVTVSLLVVLMLAGGSEAQRRSRGRSNRTARVKRPAKPVEPVPKTRSEHCIQLKLQLPPEHRSDSIRLLPDPDKLTDGDATILYQQASAALPQDIDNAQVATWAKMKPAELPMQKVKQVLASSESALQLTEKAALCRTCWKAGGPDVDLSLFRRLAYLMCTKTAYEMAGNNHAGALNAMQTNLSMARHLAEGPTLIHGLVGVSVGALACKQIAVYGEQAGAPSLYQAIHDLPHPLISLEKQIEAEIANLDTDPRVNAQNRDALKKKQTSSHERIRLLTKRFSRDLAALECIAGLRLYAASHKRELPQSLKQIRGIRIPLDPIYEKPFSYSCSDGRAFLESAPRQGERPKEGLQYEITIANAP